MIFNLEKKGLKTVLKPYQADIMRYIWEMGETDSRHAHEHLQETDNGMSRASVIFFLNDMVDEGFLTFREETGKGGYHRIWIPAPDVKCERDFKETVARRILEKLRSDFGVEAEVL